MPPYQFGNPTNDFYIRQAQQLSQQPQFVPQFQSQPYQPQQGAPQATQFVARFVTNIEEAKAAMIDAMSTYLFVDSSNGRIYLKKMNNNGLSEFYVYVIEDSKQGQNIDPLTEINRRLTNIENFLGGLTNDKPVQGNAGGDEPAGVPSTAVATKNDRHDEAEPAGFSKNAGNGWRKK